MTPIDNAATFLLIPGAGGDAWYWHRLVEEITRRGRVALAVELPADDPTAGLDRYVEVAVSAGSGHADVIVVGQSMGGFTAPLLCGRLPVRQLVLLNAMIPRPHETAGEWWANTGHQMPDNFDSAVHFFHDVPPEISDVALAGGKEQSGRPFADPWPLDRWPEVATRVISSSDDRFFPIEFQTRVARERLGIQPETMPGGHLVALSRPSELADLLLAGSDDHLPLRLVVGTLPILDAELDGDHHQLAQLLGVDAIAEWPPIGGEHDHDAARYFRQALLDDPASAKWLV